MRWKGHVPTLRTLINQETTYYRAVCRWHREGRDPEGLPALEAWSDKIEAIRTYVYSGEITEGYGIEETPPKRRRAESPQLALV